MRVRERQLDAQHLSADAENRTWPVPAPLSTCERFGLEKSNQERRSEEDLIRKPGKQECRRFNQETRKAGMQKI
jgi:hypothetical protein